jgi:cell pole-organizing protein PopZ
MTQPAKSQEPSMEEILASIRRIIADDNAGKKPERVTEAPVAPAVPPPEVREAVTRPDLPPRPSFFDSPEPAPAEIRAEASAGSAGTSASEEDQSSAILDLTESMTARIFGQPEPVVEPSATADPIPQIQDTGPAAQFQESEWAPQFHGPRPMPQFHEPEPAPQVHDPEPTPQFHDPRRVPQFHDPGPAPEFHEPKSTAQFHEPEPAPQFRVTENYPDASAEDVVEQRPMPRAFEQPAPSVAPATGQRGAGERDAGERGQLLSSATSAAVDSAFNALAQTVLVQNARTLEDLVREMLRPMLKTWLDDNLPGMVERLVRAEIERVARGR